MGKDAERGKYTSPEGSRTWEYLSALFCAIGTFCIGNVIGWNSPSLSELQAPDSRIQITPGEASTLTAALSMGQIFALPLSVFTVDRLGRKNTILISAVPLMASWGMILLAEDALVLILARMLSGLSVGMILATAPIYMGEILSSDIRGSLGAFGGIACYTAVLFMFAAAPHLGIRMTAGFCMGFAMVLLICFWFAPESPYFLVKVGRIDEAETALGKLRGKTDVGDELELIKATICEKGKSLLETDDSGKEESTKKQSAVKQLFTIRGNLKALFIGIVGTTLQHFCGFTIILYYCHMILTDMGSGLDVYIATIIFSVLQIFTAGSNTLSVDRFGRRPMLLISGITTTLLLTIIATYFFLKEHTTVDVRQYSMISVGSVFALVVVLNIGVMSVPNTIQGEIYSTDVKMLAVCIVGLCGTAMSIICSKFYLLMVQTWGLGHSIPFYGFAVTTFLCIVILMRLLPETRGKTLLQIQKELNA